MEVFALKKRTIWNKVADFLEGRGFYIVLALCLAAIGGSGYYLYRTVSLAGALPDQTVSARAEVPADLPEPDLTVPAPEDGDSDDGTPESGTESAGGEAAESGILEEEPADGAEGDEDLDAEPAAQVRTREKKPAQEKKEEPPATETARWSWPVEGEVIEAFSPDTLTYNAAMEDWRVHTGVDISAEVGDPVASATDGTVMAVKEDVLLGRTVTVQTPDGMSILYGNLAEEAAVTAGDQVEAGQMLGSVGDTAPGERHEGGWLHLAAERDGSPVNPMEYLDKG